MGAFSTAVFILLLTLGLGGSKKPKPSDDDDAPPDDDTPEDPPDIEDLPDVDPGKPPRLPTIPVIPAGPDESILDTFEDDELDEQACTLWAARVGSESDGELALRLCKGLFPSLNWTLPLPLGSKRGLMLGRLTTTFASIRSGALVCDSPITPESTPRAGGYYQIKKGDTLLGIVQKAYPQYKSSASLRLQAAKTIIAHPRNGGGVAGSGIVVPAGQCAPSQAAWNTKNIGPTIVDFCKNWRCNPSTESQRFLTGSCYAVVYLPLI
jgi:hypothetical protein